MDIQLHCKNDHLTVNLIRISWFLKEVNKGVMGLVGKLLSYLMGTYGHRSNYRIKRDLKGRIWDFDEILMGF